MANITITHKVENLQAYSTNVLHNIIKQVRFVIDASDGSQSKTSFFTVELDDPDAKTSDILMELKLDIQRLFADEDANP